MTRVTPGDAAAAVRPRLHQGAHLLADADRAVRARGAAGRTSRDLYPSLRLF